MARPALAVLLAALLAWLPLAAWPQQDTPRIAAPASASPPEDGQWVMPMRDHANTRFSGLDEINAENVSRLQVAFTFSTGVNRGQESAPIVVGSTLYLVTPYPNILYALDLSRPGAPMKWRYHPRQNAAAQGVACCDTVNRGPTFADGRIFYNTLDGQTVAIDAETGRELWTRQLGNINVGETMTMAPLVVRDRVIVGNSGGEYGVRGWIAALDVRTGEVAWRAFNTGPDREVLIGPDFRPFYESDRGTDLGVSTWPPQAWQQGGGNVWGWVSYDPDLNLIYHGTGNPGPWNPAQRPGDNKWTAGVFARDATTGAARWFYQWSPHDLWDHDGINELILLDLEWEGRQRRVIVSPQRVGYVYVLDRKTGEVLSARPFHHNTVMTGVDLRTGRPQLVPGMEPHNNRVVRNICPVHAGAKDWNPSAFSPRTGLLYIPHNNLCMDWESVEPNYIAGTPYLGAEARLHPGPGGHRGEFSAWNILEGREAWTIREDFPLWSGTIATAGDVVFYGTMDGWFKAVHAQSGEELWRFRLDSGIIGQPTTFRGPDGRQYVAVLSGVGGWAGAIVSNDLDPRDATAGGGWVNVMRDLPERTTKGGTLYVFRLP
jgi:alcohol dehydrogenase (cytochrome c)